MKKWQDVSSYSRDDAVRVPKSFSMKSGEAELTVSRWIHGDKERWYGSLQVGNGYLLDRRDLGKDLAAAQAKLVALARKEIEKILKGLPPDVEDV